MRFKTTRPANPEPVGPRRGRSIPDDNLDICMAICLFIHVMNDYHS